LTKTHTLPSKKDRVAVYEIRIRGHLDKDWTEWFHGLTLTHTCDGHTILTGPVADQSALRSVLNRIWNLNLALISVNLVESNRKIDRTPIELGS
jgi:hypothetical protein